VKPFWGKPHPVVPDRLALYLARPEGGGAYRGWVVPVRMSGRDPYGPVLVSAQDMAPDDVRALAAHYDVACVIEGSSLKALADW
jgi:hypothetical protein